MVLRLLAAGVLSAVAFVLWAVTSPPAAVQSAVHTDEQDEQFVVTRILDGDTIVVNGGQKVRYIGIDAPEFYGDSQEPECFAREARLKNERLVLGKKVRLVRDVSDTDTYGRLLRYVYLIDSQTDAVGDVSVNEALVREGYAFAHPVPPDVSLQDTLRTLEADARRYGRGLWSTCITDNARTRE